MKLLQAKMGEGGRDVVKSGESEEKQPAQAEGRWFKIGLDWISNSPLKKVNIPHGEIKKPENSSGNLSLSNSSLSRSPSTSPTRKVRKPENLGSNVKWRMPNSSLSRSISLPTKVAKAENMASALERSQSDSKAMMEPSATIYSRFKNVVTEAIQKIWSVFQ